MFVPMPERSGLPVPQAREQIPGQEETVVVIFSWPASAWPSKLLMEGKEQELFDIVLSNDGL